MDYDTALRAVHHGQRVRRTAWQPGAFLLSVPGSTITVEADRPLGKAAPELVGQQVRYSSHIDIYSGGYLAPWFASTEDYDAHDWEIR